MNLLNYFETFYLPARALEGVEASTINHTKVAIKWFSGFLGRDIRLDDLNDAELSGLIGWVIDHGRQPSYGRYIAERLLALWRHAVWNGHLPATSSAPKVKLLVKTRAFKPRSERKGWNPKIPNRAEKKKPAVAPAPVFVPECKATRETTLTDFLFKHYVTTHDLGALSIDAMKHPITWFSRFLGRPAVVGDLNSTTINGLLIEMLNELNRETVYSYRRMILVLWRWAYETEVLQEFPRRVRPIKRPQRVIQGYDAAQMETLLATIDKFPGTFRKTGITKALYWRAFVIAAWYSGLRVSDILAMEAEEIAEQPDGSGRLTVIMKKTGQAIHRAFPPDAMDAIAACVASGNPRAKVFPLWACRRAFFRTFRLISTTAGVGGSLKFIRRGSASACEAAHPGGGRTHLGHRSPGLFETNYKVDSIVNEQIHLPPSIRARKDGAA
jgi:integrase